MPKQIATPPNLNQLDKKSPQIDAWFLEVNGRMNVYSGTADPTTSQVPKGQWVLYKNTTSGEIRWWTNDNGVMKKSAAFT